MLIISAVRLKCNVVFCTIFYRKRPLLGNFFVNTGLEIRWRNIPAEPLKLRLFSWRNRRPHRLPPSVPEPAAPRHPLPRISCAGAAETCAGRRLRTAGPEPRKPRNSVLARRPRPLISAARSAMSNVCRDDRIRQGPPRSGAAFGFYQMVAPIFPPRRTDRNSRPSRGRSGSRPCGSRS